jgi:hypothetical protein
MRGSSRGTPHRGLGRTVYDAWLHAIEPVFVAHGPAFPDVMRTDAWAAKAHQAGLGSYAELKHDTILYAKQAVAEGGDAGVPSRRNWVEPEPVVFDARRDGEPHAPGSRPRPAHGGADDLLANVTELFSFFGRIARDELAGFRSGAGQRAVTYIGGQLEAI